MQNSESRRCQMSAYYVAAGLIANNHYTKLYISAREVAPNAWGESREYVVSEQPIKDAVWVEVFERDEDKYAKKHQCPYSIKRLLTE